MPLTNVLSVQPRPEDEIRYVELVQQLAQRAVQKKDRFRWTTHSTAFGTQGPMFHFVSQSADWAGIGGRGTPLELFDRVLGAKAAAEWRQNLLSCTASSRNTISIDRPDLSYPPDRREPSAHPFAVVTTLRVKPGGQEAVEELLRKLAEAIPKVDDPARVIVNQTVVGDLREYWSVRPLRDLKDLDRHRLPQRLLEEAFGAPEGGLIFRGAMESMETAERALVQYLPDLSHPE
jgi:hypothetical protein